jgi:heparan-alpha-glucosaminide N-acetyltransferase
MSMVVSPGIVESQGILEPAASTPLAERLVSLDAYRGFVMIVLALEGYIPAIAQRFPNSAIWQALGRQFVHVDWNGGVFWDLIQPSFMFIVGVAIPFSYFSRCAKGETSRKIAAHVMFRSFLLVILGLLLRTGTANHQTIFEFDDILCQIGLAYPFAYAVVGKKRRVQLIVTGLILASYWLAFYLYPLPPQNLDYATLGVTDGTERFSGLYAHWNRYTNFAASFDRWFLNLFPRTKDFLYNPLGLATLNFVPSIVTLLCGVMAGELLRGPEQRNVKLLKLCKAGSICFVVGLIAGYTVCPIIKAIWTPSWVLLSGGFTLWFLAAFYWAADIKGWKRLLFPLMVVGMNSMAMYLMIRLSKDWLWKVVEIHAGGLSWSMQFAAVTLIFWIICFWMFQKKIFIRL